MDEFHTCRHLLDHKFPCFVCLGLNPLKAQFPGRDWDFNGLNIASFESQLTRGSNSIGPNQGCDKPATPRPPHPPCQALATRTREILRKRLVGFMDSYKVMPHSWISSAEKTPICINMSRLALRLVFSSNSSNSFMRFVNRSHGAPHCNGTKQWFDGGSFPQNINGWPTMDPGWPNEYPW